jgi:hypothetical protein
MHDPMWNAAQRNQSAGKKRGRLGQTAKTRGNPAAMTLREVFRFGDRASRRHGEDGFAVAWMNSQRISARAPMSAQSDRIDLRAMLDEKTRRFGGPPIE